MRCRAYMVGAAAGLLLSSGAFTLADARDGGLSTVTPHDAGTTNHVASDGGLSKVDSASPSPQWMPKVAARVSKSDVTLGEPFELTVEINRSRGVSVTLPLRLELGAFSELSRKDPGHETPSRGAESKNKGPSNLDQEKTFSQVHVLTLAAYTLGELTIPPIELTALGPGGELISLHTDPIQIHVVSVLKNEPNPEIKPFKPPVSVGERRWWPLYLLLGLVAAALIAGATVLVYRRVQERKRAERPPPPPIPAHVTALKKLEALDVDGLMERGQFKELYLALSEIMREYVGGSWGFDALEMTTTEISDALRRAGVPPETFQRLERFFNDCDLVKFAKYLPELSAAKQAVEEAEAIVREASDKREGQA